jgi:hypothetical protein
MGLLPLLRKIVERIESELACSSKNENRAYRNEILASADCIPSARSEDTLKIATVDEAMQRGSIESGLVLIPTTLFFLMALQVLLAGSWQTIERARLHDLVIKSSIKESLGESSPLFEGDSTYLSGNSHSIRTGTTNAQRALLNVRDDLTPVGTIRTMEMSTPLPVLGNFLHTVDQGIFQIRNYAVSFVD